MPRLTDLIEEFIKEMMNDNEESELEIGRNELANYFSCAPSQINYVLTTRFTTDKGYYIESRRGGGGFIKIKRVKVEENEPLFSVINRKIGSRITYDSSCKIIDGLLELRILQASEANIMKAAITERVLANCSINKNILRANILKSMLMAILL